MLINIGTTELKDRGKRFREIRKTDTVWSITSSKSSTPITLSCEAFSSYYNIQQKFEAHLYSCFPALEKQFTMQKIKYFTDILALCQHLKTPACQLPYKHIISISENIHKPNSQDHRALSCENTTNQVCCNCELQHQISIHFEDTKKGSSVKCLRVFFLKYFPTGTMEY